LLLKSTKFVLEFCGLDLLGTLAWLILQPSVASTVVSLRISARAPCPFITINLLRNFQQFLLRKIFEQRHTYSLLIATVKKTQATTHCCLKLRWESLRGWDFGPQLAVVSGPFGGNPLVDGIFRPQLVVVSGLFGGNPFVDGILGHNLLLSQASFFTMEIRPLRSLCYELFSFFTMEFWLPRSPSHELFSFFTIGFRLPQSLSHEFFSFFTMGFWLSQSLSHELFFSFFTMGFRLSQSLSHEFFSFFTMGFRLSQSLSYELFSFFTMGSFFTIELWKYAIWRKTLFIHISQRVFT
jgi:hypothetical protein